MEKQLNLFEQNTIPDTETQLPAMNTDELKSLIKAGMLGHELSESDIIDIAKEVIEEKYGTYEKFAGSYVNDQMKKLFGPHPDEVEYSIFDSTIHDLENEADNKWEELLQKEKASLQLYYNQLNEAINEVYEENDRFVTDCDEYLSQVHMKYFINCQIQNKPFIGYRDFVRTCKKCYEQNSMYYY